MVTVKRTEEFLAHTGKKGMKWGYNDGSRNGRRTASELKKVAKAVVEYQKNNTDPNAQGTDDVEGDYHEANNMLKYLGITLDLQSDDEKVAETMAIYNQMKNTKDDYKSQHDWLKAFSKKLASAGYDMKAVDNMLDENKDTLNKLNTGTGSGNREKSNQDWKENDAKKTKASTKTKKSTKSKDKDSEKKTTSSSTAKKETKSSTSSETKKWTPRHRKTTKTDTNKKSYSYRPASSYSRGGKSLTHVDSNQNGELYHHGILGQRWGVRRYQNVDGSLTSEGKKRYNGKSEYGYGQGNKNSAKKYSKKRASRMTNDELDAAASRLNKEANYKQASDRLKGKSDNGQAAKDRMQNLAIMSTSIVVVATNYPKIIQAGKTAVNTVLKKIK